MVRRVGIRGVGVWDSEFKVQDSGFRVKGLHFKFQVFGCKVEV
jgi:hypothetical protein